MNNNLLTQPWMPIVLGGIVLVFIRLVWPWLCSLFVRPKRPPWD